MKKKKWISDEMCSSSSGLLHFLGEAWWVGGSGSVITRLGLLCCLSCWIFAESLFWTKVCAGHEGTIKESPGWALSVEWMKYIPLGTFSGLPDLAPAPLWPYILPPPPCSFCLLTLTTCHVLEEAKLLALLFLYMCLPPRAPFVQLAFYFALGLSVKGCSSEMPCLLFSILVPVNFLPSTFHSV